MTKINSTNFFICFIFISLFGYLFLIWNNIDKFAYALKQKVEVAVFLKQNEKSSEVVHEKIRALDNVASVTFISRERIREKMGKYRNEIDITGGNPFPDSFLVIPKEYNFGKIDYLAGQLLAIPGVEDVRFDRNSVLIIDGLKLFARFTRNLCRLIMIMFVIGIILVFLNYYRSFTAIFIQKYLDLITGFIGLLLGIVCLKILSIIIIHVSVFIPAGQIILLIISGIMLDIIISLSNVTINE